MKFLFSYFNLSDCQKFTLFMRYFNILRISWQSLPHLYSRILPEGDPEAQGLRAGWGAAFEWFFNQDLTTQIGIVAGVVAVGYITYRYFFSSDVPPTGGAGGAGGDDDEGGANPPDHQEANPQEEIPLMDNRLDNQNPADNPAVDHPLPQNPQGAEQQDHDINGANSVHLDSVVIGGIAAGGNPNPGVAPVVLPNGNINPNPPGIGSMFTVAFIPAAPQQPAQQRQPEANPQNAANWVVIERLFKQRFVNPPQNDPEFIYFILMKFLEKCHRFHQPDFRNLQAIHPERIELIRELWIITQWIQLKIYHTQRGDDMFREPGMFHSLREFLFILEYPLVPLRPTHVDSATLFAINARDIALQFVGIESGLNFNIFISLKKIFRGIKTLQ